MIDHKVGIFLLQQVKMTLDNLCTLMGRMLPNDMFYYSKVNGVSRGITTIWNPNSIKGDMFSSSHHFLVVTFSTPIMQWKSFNVYACNTK